MDGVARRLQLLKHGKNLQDVAMFGSLKPAVMRQLAMKMQDVSFAPGEVVVLQGDPGDSMYVVQEGSCTVDFSRSSAASGRSSLAPPDLLPGAVFGELALLTGEPRSATIAAGAEGARAVKLMSADVKPILDNAWGGDAELDRRKQMLASCSLFKYLTQGELLLLATLVEPVTFGEEQEEIVTEGKLGDCMYIVDKGRPKVFIKGVGMVKELLVGDCFGELAIVDAPASYRSATVTTMGPTELLKLSQSSVHRLLSSEKCKEALAVDAGVYDQRAKLRSSKLVDHEVRRLWDVMVSESMRLEAGTLAHRKEAKREGVAGRWRRLRQASRLSLQKVTRPGYTEMHLRISKFLRASFGLEMAISIAQTDWAEDITAYSGDSVVDIWLEELKKKLRDETASTVALLGWKRIFNRYDDDGSGLIELKEFRAAVRNDMRLGDDVISTHELDQLFAQADADGGGSLTSEEFATWVLDTATGDSSPRQVQAKTLIQDASRAIVTQIGWDELFLSKDTDGGGTLGMAEFGAIVRGDCEIDETALPEEELAQLFQAVDTDASGEISPEEFGTFISSDRLAMDMTYDIFAESCFQLAQMWVAVASAEQYANFLKAIFDGITTTKGRLRSIVRDDIDMSDEEAVKRASAASEGPSAELAFAGDYRLADLDDIVCVENDSGGLDIEGVDTMSHADTMVPRFVGDTGAKSKPKVNRKTSRVKKKRRPKPDAKGGEKTSSGGDKRLGDDDDDGGGDRDGDGRGGKGTRMPPWHASLKIIQCPVDWSGANAWVEMEANHPDDCDPAGSNSPRLRRARATSPFQAAVQRLDSTTPRRASATVRRRRRAASATTQRRDPRAVRRPHSANTVAPFGWASQEEWEVARLSSQWRLADPFPKPQRGQSAAARLIKSGDVTTAAAPSRTRPHSAAELSYVRPVPAAAPPQKRPQSAAIAAFLEKELRSSDEAADEGEDSIGRVVQQLETAMTRGRTRAAQDQERQQFNARQEMINDCSVNFDDFHLFCQKRKKRRQPQIGLSGSGEQRLRALKQEAARTTTISRSVGGWRAYA